MYAQMLKLETGDNIKYKRVFPCESDVASPQIFRR